MKRLFIVFALVCVAALIARVETPVQGQGQGQGQGSGDSSEIKAGVGAVPPEITLDLSGKNRSLVYEGSYYVNGISDCVGCHNGPEGDDPANPIPLEDRYLAGGQDFGRSYLSRVPRRDSGRSGLEESSTGRR
jgi:hypothetical protein